MINIDAAFDSDSGTGATGAVIRDHTGGFIAAAENFLEHVADAPMAEAYALKEGLMLAQQIGCNRVIFQSHCMQVVDTMKDGGFSATTAAAIYEECHDLWKNFANVDIQHCNREANQVAHQLAREAFSAKQSCIWVDEPPSSILGYLMQDVTILSDEIK